MRILVLIFLLLLFNLPNAVALSFNSFITTGSSGQYATVDSADNLYLHVHDGSGNTANRHVAVFDSNLTELRTFSTVADASAGPVTIYNDELYASENSYYGDIVPLARYNLNGDPLETNTTQGGFDLLISSNGTIRPSHGEVYINNYFDTGNYVLSGFGEASRLALGENDTFYISDPFLGVISKYDSYGGMHWSRTFSFYFWDIEVVGDKLLATSHDGVEILSLIDGSHLGGVDLGLHVDILAASENYLYVSGGDGTAVYDIDDFANLVPEPSTYALIFGAVALGFAISRRK